MEKHGGGKRRTFSAEYKAEAVRLVSDSGKSIGVIALELGLGETEEIRPEEGDMHHLLPCRIIEARYPRLRKPDLCGIDLWC